MGTTLRSRCHIGSFHYFELPVYYALNSDTDHECCSAGAAAWSSVWVLAAAVTGVALSAVGGV